jgi:hypothetical protein
MSARHRRNACAVACMRHAAAAALILISLRARDLQQEATGGLTSGSGSELEQASKQIES